MDPRLTRSKPRARSVSGSRPSSHMQGCRRSICHAAGCIEFPPRRNSALTVARLLTPTATCRPMAEEPTVYANQLPEELEAEFRDAERVRIRGVAAPSDEFDKLADAGEQLIYVVLQSRVLVVCEAVGYPAHHSVLAHGDPVIAAGELSLVVYQGERTVLTATAVSGHYRPRPDCLTIVFEVLQGLGFTVPETVLPS